MKHKCIHNENGMCKWCGCFAGLNKSESEVYLKGLVGGCFESPEMEFWSIHKKHLKATK